MNKKTAIVLACVCAVGMSTQLSGAIPKTQFVSDVHAQQRQDYKHTINLAGAQRMLSQRISKEVLLVALGYNSRENLRNLRSSHDKFARVLRGLHYGDAELALLPTEEQNVVEQLERVEELWPLFESALQDGLARGKVTRDTVGIVSDLSLPLLKAMDDTVKAYEEAATQGTLFSMIEIAIDQGGKLRMLSQKMSKEFLLIAYNENAEQNRASLRKSMKTFAQVLAGLVSGDANLQLIPAPTAQLQAQLRAVGRVWQESKPIFELAARGKELNRDQLADVASLNLALLAEADTVVRMYEAF